MKSYKQFKKQMDRLNPTERFVAMATGETKGKTYSTIKVKRIVKRKFGINLPLKIVHNKLIILRRRKLI